VTSPSFFSEYLAPSSLSSFCFAGICAKTTSRSDEAAREPVEALAVEACARARTVGGGEGVW
jgi:hypothetical protein